MTLAIMGGILGIVLPRRLGAGVAPPAVPRRGRPDRHRPDGRAHLRRQGRAVLDHPARHVRHPDPRRQHGLRRASPRLSSIIARDGYLPRQLANRGDKLVFSNGILFLAVAAGVLIVVFKGNISALIPLYAFGVFTGFTLSQAGMVRPPPPSTRAAMAGRRWRSTPSARVATGDRGARRRRLQVHRGGVDPGRADPGAGGRRSAPINKHYRRCARAVQVDTGYTPQRRTHLVVVLVGTVHRGVIDAVPLRQVAGARAAHRRLGRDRRRGAGARSSKAWDRRSRCRSRCTRSRRRTAS